MANNAHHQMYDRPALLLTRPQSSAQAFVAQLDLSVVAGVSVVISPLLEIAPTHAAFDLSGYQGVIFTSAHAVGCVDMGNGLNAYCVGARTAEVAQARGWDVKLVAQTADDLVSKINGAAGPLLHIAGAHRRGEVAGRLTALGIRTDVTIVYEQLPQTLSAVALELLNSSAQIIAPLFSPRTAAIFADQVPSTAELHIVAMSEAVASALGKIVPKTLMIAPAPTGAEMRRSVENLLLGTTLP